MLYILSTECYVKKGYIMINENHNVYNHSLEINQAINDFENSTIMDAGQFEFPRRMMSSISNMFDDVNDDIDDNW